MDQRPGTRDGSGLSERQRLFGDLLMAADTDRTDEPRKSSAGGLMQRRPRHIETLGAEHQPVHARMRLRVGDIGFGPGRCLLDWRVARSISKLHRRVELPETDRREFAHKPGEIAEMMGRRGMRYAGFARHGA